jgi:hypothetical protein
MVSWWFITVAITIILNSKKENREKAEADKIAHEKAQKESEKRVKRTAKEAERKEARK